MEFMWFFVSLLAGLLFTIQGLLTRKLLKGEGDAWAFSFYFSLVGALIAAPFMLSDLKLATNAPFWLLMVVTGGLVSLFNYLSLKSNNYLEASILGAMSKLRLLWVLLLGILFLGESLTTMKVLGTMLTLMAGLLIYSKAKSMGSKLGVALAFIAAVLYAVIIALIKVLYSEFNAVSLTFFIFALPTVINFAIMPNATHRIREMAKLQGKVVLVAAITGSLATLAMNQALLIGEASRVLVIIEAFLIVVLVGEHIFLKETDRLLNKLIAVLLATIGAILIQITG